MKLSVDVKITLVSILRCDYFFMNYREGNLDIVELLYSTEDAKAISNNGRSPLHTAGKI